MEKEIVMTYAGLRAIEEELEMLKTVKRKEVAEKIKIARGYGDLSENSEYDEAKNEQGIVEQEILELEETIKTARVIDENDLNMDFYVAMESGITDKFGCWLNVTTAYVEDKNGDNAVGLGPAYQIPDRYIDEVKEKELSYVLAKVLKTEEQKTPQGGIVHLTKGNVTRIDLAEYAFIMALTHFVNGDVWK